MESLLGTVKPLVGALLMPLPVFLGLTLLGLALLAAGGGWLAGAAGTPLSRADGPFDPGHGGRPGRRRGDRGPGGRLVAQRPVAQRVPVVG